MKIQYFIEIIKRHVDAIIHPTLVVELVLIILIIILMVHIGTLHIIPAANMPIFHVLRQYFVLHIVPIHITAETLKAGVIELL